MSDDSPEQENGIVGSGGEPAKKPPSKKLTVEKIYQKKSQLEHILLRPDTYIGKISAQYTWLLRLPTPPQPMTSIPLPG